MNNNFKRNNNLGSNAAGHRSRRRWLIPAAAVFILLLFLILRFTLFYFTTGGLSGISAILPLLLICTVFFAVCMTCIFSIWVYHDCRIRREDPALWVVIVILATPFIGLLIYFLRRPEIRQNCPACGHKISLHAKFCEECGARIMNKEALKKMTVKHTHHLIYLVTGALCMVFMLICLAGFIGFAAYGGGINTSVTSNERIWNTGIIAQNHDACINNVWTLDFSSASKGFIEEVQMDINDPEKDVLYADVSCGSVPEGSSLTLWLVQGDTVSSVDVTQLSKPLEYPLDAFSDGRLYVRLQINGVENVTSKISIH